MLDPNKMVFGVESCGRCFHRTYEVNGNFVSLQSRNLQAATVQDGCYKMSLDLSC